MRVITNTNIIVDDFDFAKDYPKNTFIHFLTHFHADHYQGMSPLWDYGAIFCTEITKKLIQESFPKMQNIIGLEINKIYQLNLITKQILNGNFENQDNKENIYNNEIINGQIDENYNINDFTISVSLFDAFHIPGSSMILFQGYFGNIFHTGDFRFNQKMFLENQILFSHSNQVQEQQQIQMLMNEQSNYNNNVQQDKQFKNKKTQTFANLQIDEMIFDNTYCSPYFNFPVSEVVLQQMIKIIEKNKNKQILIAMGALGKEDICIKLSEHFQTQLLIRENKLQQLKAIGCYRTDIFTTDPKQSWIEIIRKKDRIARLQQEKENNNKNYICISTDFLMLEHKDPDRINYIVPYSLHSNYLEMEQLIKAVQPCILRRLVLPIFTNPKFKREQRISFREFYLKYGSNITKKGESGYAQLKQKYTDFTKLSSKFKFWMQENMQDYLMKLIKIDVKPNPSLRKRKQKELDENYQEIYVPTGKESLSEIAARLRSTHNNKNIQDYFLPKNNLSNSINFIDQNSNKLQGENLNQKQVNSNQQSVMHKKKKMQKQQLNEENSPFRMDDELNSLMGAFINQKNNSNQYQQQYSDDNTDISVLIQQKEKI